MDKIILEAARQVREAKVAQSRIITFFDEATFTATHVVIDIPSRRCAIIDSVLDYDPASGRTSTASARRIVDFVRSENLTVDWLLETHIHADHLTAAPFLKAELGGKAGIGAGIVEVQSAFGALFNEDDGFRRDASQFDHVFADGEIFRIGTLGVIALHVPGHTPADFAYLVGDAAFVGDTVFMPDYGTARADFPGGDAAQLYRSIRRLLSLPGETRVFVCHDYKAPGREAFAWETTVAAQRARNVHVHDAIAEADFVSMRNERDAGLATPRLMFPAVQVNMRAGRFPPPEDNGATYLKIPIDRL